MKALSLIVFFSGLCASAYAQLSIGAVQDAHNASNAARHLPTFLGDGFDRFQVNAANAYFSLGSNFATMGDARAFLRSDTYSDELIGRNLRNMHSQDNFIAGSLDVSLINVAMHLGDPEAPVSFSLGLGANERIELSAIFNEDAFRFAYNGNKQFAGSFVELAPRFDGLAFTEYYASAACNIVSPGGWSMKPAIRISYLSGQASVDMQDKNSIAVYTDPGGRYLNFSLDYNINTSLGGDSVKLEGSSFNLDGESLQSGAGSGFGMDLGLRISPHPGLSFDIGVMDIGSIRFTKSATNMYNHSTYRYEGVDINFAENQSLNLDSLASFARPSYSHGGYSVRLPAKLILSGSIGLGKIESGRRTFYRHQISCLYVQGFANYLSATKKPYIGAGYTYSFGGVVNVGVNAGLGGITGGQMGLLASLKAGPFLLGVMSNNMLPLLAPQAGRGTDAGLLLGLAF